MGKEQLGYLVWGLLALAVLIPEALAALGRRTIPWPGLARTATNLEARYPKTAMLFLAGLAVLAVHLVFYPWPELRR